MISFIITCILCIISTYCIDCMKWALASFEIELLHSAWEWRYVSTVTFYQSHRHLLQKYYYAEFALHMFTFCHASLHSASVWFYQHQTKLILNLQLCAIYFNSESYKISPRVKYQGKNTCNCLKSIHSNDVFLLEN